MQKPNNITENTLEGKKQLMDDKLQKSIEKITDENKNVSESEKSKTNIKKESETDKSASYDINLEKGDANEKENKEDEKKQSSKKTTQKKKPKISNKKKKLKTLVIDLDNKFDLQKCFNKWNILTPNLNTINKDLDKKDENINYKSNNLNQITKEELVANDNNNTEEDNLEKIKSSETDEIKKNIDKTNNKRFKKKIIKKKDDAPNKAILLSDNINKKEDNDKNTNINDIKSKIGEEDKNIIKKKLNKQDEILKKKDENISMKNEIFINKDEIQERSALAKSESPKMKEIVINKRVTIVTKRRSKTKYEDIKNKLLERRFLIKFWKIWKEKNKLGKEKDKQKEDEKEDQKEEQKEKKDKKELKIKDKNEEKNPTQKGKKKSFILKINKVSIKKKILELPKAKIVTHNNEIKEKIINLRKQILGSNKTLLKRHAFLKWKKNTEFGNHIVIGIDIIRKIMRRYIVRYLIMHAKILKFKSFLINYYLVEKNK